LLYYSKLQEIARVTELCFRVFARYLFLWEKMNWQEIKPGGEGNKI